MLKLCVLMVILMIYNHYSHFNPMLSVCFLTQNGGKEINQGHKLVDLQTRFQAGSHNHQGNMGTTFKHWHLIELPVLHGELSVVSCKDHHSVVEQATVSKGWNDLTCSVGDRQ